MAKRYVGGAGRTFVLMTVLHFIANRPLVEFENVLGNSTPVKCSGVKMHSFPRLESIPDAGSVTMISGLDGSASSFSRK
jgi:hypothetical protein